MFLRSGLARVVPGGREGARGRYKEGPGRAREKPHILFFEGGVLFPAVQCNVDVFIFVCVFKYAHSYRSNLQPIYKNWLREPNEIFF